MADPLSIVTGIFGIVVTALQGTRALLDNVDRFSDASVAVQALKRDLCSLNTTLGSLQSITEPQWELLGSTSVEELKITISNYTNSCNMLESDIKHWTRHSENGKMTLQDRATIVLKHSRIKSMSEQLQNYRVTLSFVINIVTLHRSIRQNPAAPDGKSKLCDEDSKLADSIHATDEQLAVVNDKLEKLTFTEPTSSSTAHIDDEGRARSITEDERTTLQLCLKLLQDLRSTNQKEIERNQTTMTWGHHNHNLGGQFGSNSGNISWTATYGSKND